MGIEEKVQPSIKHQVEERNWRPMISKAWAPQEVQGRGGGCMKEKLV